MSRTRRAALACARAARNPDELRELLAMLGLLNEYGELRDDTPGGDPYIPSLDRGTGPLTPPPFKRTPAT